MNLFSGISTYIRLLAASILLVCGCLTNGHAQTFTFHTTEASAVATGNKLYTHGFPDTLTVWCNDWDNILSNITNWGDDFKLKSNHSFLKFYVDHYSLITKYQAPVNYNYLLAFKLTGFIDPADTVTPAGRVTDVDTLTINFNNDEVNNPYQDLNLKKYSNFYKIMVELINIYRDSAGFVVPALINDTTVRNFAIEASILTQHYDKHEYGMGSGTTTPVISATPHPVENYLQLVWNYTTHSVSPVNYELEWTYIDDYGVPLPGGIEGPKPFASLNYDFRFNNTRVWLSGNSYNIPLVYSRGYIVYRVRAVRPDSIQYKFPVYGNWTNSLPDQGTISSLSAGDYYAISTPYAGDSLNWQYTASFAEGGRYKNVATFYDGLLKNRQSITRLNSNYNKLIATGNIYDHEGRLCIKSLPAPVDVPSFTYQYGLLLNSVTSQPYQAADFDTGSLHFGLISPLANNALANIYYSDQNSDTLIRHQKFVADAQGYPLVQTIFESGSQNRVLAQGGAGLALQIGNPNYVANEYIDAPQPLLNSLFGPNVGWNKFYNMTVSRDPNQQYSMTINDYHGKPMVSALIGDGPSASTHAIDHVAYPDSSYVKQNLLAAASSQDVDVLGGTRVADINYFSEASSTDTLQYIARYVPFQACPGQYLTPKGHVNITVTDQYGDVVLSQDSVIGYTSVDTSGAGMDFAYPAGHFPAHIGKYHVNKSLTISPWEFETVMDSFLKVANCFLPLPTFIRQSVSSKQFPCQGDFGGPAYDSDDCISREWLMMQQLFPNAAYGKYTIKDGMMTSTPNSIYTIFCNCYHAFTLYGEDTSLLISLQGARGIVNHRAPFTQVTIPDTCVADTFFTHNITIKVFSYFDSIHTIYMPFIGNVTPSDTGMVGYYRLQSNWNLGRINGSIYENGVVVGSVSQRAGYHHSVPDTSIFVLPISISGTHFTANIHGNALSSAGDSLFFTFSGEQTIPYAHSPSWESPYVDYHDPGCLARYQDTCLLPNFPDTITVNGTFHSGLRTMDHVAFNNLYSEAVTTGNYSIARALLPLHPQYCELQNCFTDNFKKQLVAITDWRTAQAMNMLFLDSLVEHDPIVTKMAATGLFPTPKDSLRKFRGIDVRLDSFIFMNAYCAASDSAMFADCVNNMFRYEIAHHQLVNNDVKKFYFSNMVGLYLSNRQRFVDSILRHSNNTCGPCSAKRMKVNGKFRIMPYPVTIDSPIALFPGGPPNGWVDNVFNADSMQLLQDSITIWYNATNAALAEAALDSIMARIAPCAIASPSSVRAALAALISSGQAPGGNFTSQQVFEVLRGFGVTPNDLCNPYAFSLSSFGFPRQENSCMSDEFYTGIQGFLSSTAVSTVLHDASSGSTPAAYSLDTVGSTAEREISRRLGSIQNVDVWAQHDAAQSLYTVHIYESGGGADSVRLMLHAYNAPDIFFGIPPPYTTTVECLRVKPRFNTYRNGLINQYGFLTTVKSGLYTRYLIGWIDSVRTMSRPEDGSIARCVPCTQMRRLYREFSDSLQAFNVKGADHPLYNTMLANFMNAALHERYTAYDYETFIHSCAIADTLPMPLYAAYATFKFGAAGADGLIATLNSVHSEYNFDDSYRDSIDIGGTSEITVSIDLKKVPEKALLTYIEILNHFATMAPPGVITSSHINEPLKDVHGSGEIGFLYEDPSYPFDPVAAGISLGTGISFSASYPKAVWMGGKFEMRTFYNVVQSGATPADISRAIYNITAYLYNHHLPGVVFVPEYKSTIDADYFKPEKQAYLSKVYDFQYLPDYEVLNNLQASNLQASIPSYAPYNVAYSKETTSGLFSNLYLWNAGMNTRYYDTLQHIIDLVSPTGNIFHAAPAVSISVTAPAQLNAYRSSDWSYWYRYFTTADTLFNVWLRFPGYIPASIHPSYQVTGPVIPLPADSLTRHFAIRATIPGSGDTIQLHGLSSFVIGNSIELNSVLLRQSPLASNGGADTFNNCERQLLDAAIGEGINNYNRYLDSIRNTIGGNFRQHVLTSLYERLDLGYTTNKKYFTLYNYDRAGNLTFTIPPAGSTPIPLGAGITAVDNARTANIPASSPTPTITKINTYKYTSFDQVREQTTINGGHTRFWFDAIGRVAFSQNANQALIGSYSYNIYDAQGRIEETGEGAFDCPYFPPYIGALPAYSPGDPAPCQYYTEISPGVYSISPYPTIITNSHNTEYSSIVSFIRMHDRRDVVRTVYDMQVGSLTNIPGLSEQQNLRNRIACVKYFRFLDSIPGYDNYDYATHYSYDPQGNVTTLTNDYPRLEPYHRRYTRIDYDYDVISGKVNMLSYNRGNSDQFFQRYTYDADNRITHVNTSHDGYIWRQDAEYTYYHHGPLARALIGDNRIQGLDYAYTIQGWLKALNGDSLDYRYDMGEDGYPDEIPAKDAVAHTIDYFSGDYTPITGRQVQHTAAPIRSLYNGNIADQATAIDTFQRLYKTYAYDQLNRIHTAGYSTIDLATGALTGISDYHSSYNYDPDGNLTHLTRYGNNGTVMDGLSYVYPSVNNDLLEDVLDTAANTYTNDLQQHLSPSLRYSYDLIGNLTANRESGQDTIYWTLYNKVFNIRNSTDTSNLEYDYDGMGNRVGKRYRKTYPSLGYSHIRSEYYIRDAQGNILATYVGNDLSSHPTDPRYDFSLAAHDIYGSSRLGQKNYFGQEIGLNVDIDALEEGLHDTARFYARLPWYSLEYQDLIHKDSIDIYGNTWLERNYAKHGIGFKQYEITDHLGNVLATLSDKRSGYGFFGTLTPGSDVRIASYKPIVTAEYDYYPFGQYMPGRYTIDTATHCLLTTYSGMGSIHTTRKVYRSAVTYYGGAGGAMASSFISQIFTVTSTGPGMGAEFSVTPVSVNADTVFIRLGPVLGTHVIYVLDNSTGSIIGNAGVTTSFGGLHPINIFTTPHSSTLKIQIECTDVAGGDLIFDYMLVKQDTTVPINIVANVCNGGGYRYGHNGQMKENEIAGVGNHYSALYWDYDPRTARRWNVDPVLKDGESSYACFSNQPITISDVNGDDGWDVAAGWAMGLITNIIPGSGEWRDSYSPTDAGDYNNGLRGADNTTLGVGMIGVGHGGGMIAAGGATAAAGGAVATTGVGAPAGAIVAGAGGAIALTGAGEVAAGTYLMASAANNKAQGYDRGVKTDDKSTNETKSNRSGKQQRLKELANDDKTSSADRGWIKQELNAKSQGKRDNIRNPPGKDMAHKRGKEAAKGHSYKETNLQTKELHKLQHKHDNFGKKNKPQ